MNTYYSAIVLLSVVAVLVTTAEPQCQCDEGSRISLTFNKNAGQSHGVCGLLTLNDCNLNITCGANSTLTPATYELESDCSDNNNTAVLHTSDNRTFSINLGCSGDKIARLEAETQKVLTLTIPGVCYKSNATNSTTAHTEKPQTTEDVNTMGNNVTTATWTPINSNDTSDNPYHSDTTQYWNSSSETTERLPNNNSTQEYTTRTQGVAVSLRVCSGLMLMILAVSSVL
ncbi:hypothetical protein BsWGS_00555 [Bradybaena similaris]